VKNVDDKENELFYILKILGAKKSLPPENDDNNRTGIPQKLTVDIDTSNNYGQYDYFRYRICKYRFLLESTIAKRPVFRDHFLLLKYLEILLEDTMSTKSLSVDLNLSEKYTQNGSMLLRMRRTICRKAY